MSPFSSPPGYGRPGQPLVHEESEAWEEHATPHGSRGARKSSLSHFLRPLHRELGNTKLFAVLLSVPQVVLGLLIEPALSRGAERNGQANGHLRADTSAAIENGRQGFSADPQRLRCVRDSYTKWVQAQALDNFPGVGGIVHPHVDDLASDNLRNQPHPRLSRQTET